MLIFINDQYRYLIAYLKTISMIHLNLGPDQGLSAKWDPSKPISHPMLSSILSAAEALLERTIYLCGATDSNSTPGAMCGEMNTCLNCACSPSGTHACCRRRVLTSSLQRFTIGSSTMTD